MDKFKSVSSLLIGVIILLVSGSVQLRSIHLASIEEPAPTSIKRGDPETLSRPGPENVTRFQLPNVEPLSVEAEYKLTRSRGSSRLVKVLYTPGQMRWEEYEPGQREPSLIKIFSNNVRSTYLPTSNYLEIYDWEPIDSRVKTQERGIGEILLMPAAVGTPFASPPALHEALQSGALVCGGEEQIAGRIASILETTEKSNLPPYRLWYDKETLFLLKSEEYQTNFKHLRTSLECTRVRYGVPLKADRFSIGLWTKLALSVWPT